MARFLVTGGAGYIGSHFVELSTRVGHQVVVLDNLSTGYKENIINAELIIGDIGDQILVKKLCKQFNFDAVFHFAGSIVVPESVKNPFLYYENNTIKSFYFIKECIKSNIAHFIFSSTAAVYGNFNIDDKKLIKEDDLTEPTNPYGRSKLLTEVILKDLASVSPFFKYASFRYFNVAGAHVNGKIGQRSRKTSTHLIKRACEVVCGKREILEIYGTDYPTRDGTCLRDYIHVCDLVEAHLLGYEYLLKGGVSSTFNCGYGEGASVKEVISAMKKVSGINFNVKHSPRRDGDAVALIADNSKIRKQLKWHPSRQNLELTCRDALNWERNLTNSSQLIESQRQII